MSLLPSPLFPPQELFIASSQQFAQETELSQRVRRWEEQMEPLLQEQAGPEGQGGLGGSQPPSRTDPAVPAGGTSVL